MLAGVPPCAERQMWKEKTYTTQSLGEIAMDDIG